LTDHLGLRLTERPYRIEDVDLEVSSVGRLPRPVGWPFQQSLDRACLAIRDEIDATSMARGTGGDAIFCYNNSASPVVDAFMDSGAVAAARAVLDLSTLTGASLWQCLRAAGRSATVARRPALRLDPGFLARQRLHGLVTNNRHPWLDECVDLPPGRQRQIDMLCSPHNLLETRLALAPDIICPLLSQPVMETAIAIPSWEWIRSGINRVVARRAFEDMLPPAIIQRRSKGGPGSFAAKLYLANRSNIREQLLEGCLVAQGIVDRNAVEKATSARGADIPKDVVRLLALVDAQAWANRWTTLGREATESPRNKAADPMDLA
jgi:asparagine synthase (glutamine-hydrolysing)